jgi:hypothetical protein
MFVDSSSASINEAANNEFSDTDSNINAESSAHTAFIPARLVDGLVVVN